MKKGGLKVYTQDGDFRYGPTRLTLVDESEPGVYAILLVSDADLENTLLEGIQPGTVIYIGKAEKETLHKRLAQTHGATGKTNSSTLRRTLGAILREKLQLVPIPRNDGKCTNYGFCPQGDESLSEWINSHLQARWSPLPQDQINTKEKNLIAKYSPVLNLSECETPLSPRIKVLRKECRNSAKKWFPPHICE